MLRLYTIEGERDMKLVRRLGVSGVLALGAALVVSASAPAAVTRAADTPCAYRDGTPAVTGRTATQKFHVVQDNCQVSYVSITILADGDVIFDTATGTYPASDSDTSLSVELPCDHGSETDLIFGPPTLYPPIDFDLGAFSFDIPCSSVGGSTGGGTGATGGGSGGSGGTGGSTGGKKLPDLVVSAAAPFKSLSLGAAGSVTITVKNKGAGPASGVHLLVSLSNNAILKGKGRTSRGFGCTGVTLLDCNLGGLESGASATATVSVSGVRGTKLFVGGQAQEIQDDAHLADNTGSLTIGLTPRVTALRVTARATTFRAGAQIAYVSLSKRASLVAQVYVNGVAQPIRWRRTFAAGTFIVRIGVNGVSKGQRFMIVIRARNGTQTSKATLRLKA
jgi:hypothetical protein